jgi:hypothetical protein
LARKQLGKALNDDAFYIDESKAYLLDGAGNANGAAGRCIELIRRTQEWRGLSSLINLINFRLIGLNAQSTFAGVTCERSRLYGMSCGNSPLWVVRDAQLIRVNETRRRLGTGQMDLQWLSFDLRRYDVIVLATDGLTLDRHRLVRTVQKYLLRPTEMPEAILTAQTDQSDDVTVLTRVI